MSGIIAQALLGATGGAATGIGNKLREEAKLKRQQALEGTRSQNNMQEQAHGSALRIGEQNLQNEYASSEAEKGRRHQDALTDKQHKQRKGLVDYELKAKDTYAKKSGEYKIDPRVKVQIDEVQSNLKHLRDMETKLRTKGSDGLGGMIGGATEEGGLTVEEINTRRGEYMGQLNSLLGNSRPTSADNSILEAAMEIPEGERADFLADLKAEGRAKPELVQAIEALYAPPMQPEPAATPAPAPAPSGGIISQAQSQPEPAPKQAPEPKPEASTPAPKPAQEFVEPFPERQANPLDEGKLGPKIESGVRAAGNAIARQADKNVSETASELSQIARGEREPYQGNIRQMLTNNPEALKRLSPEDIELLKQKYGAKFIDQFLN